jgi:hypothetical protein
MLGSFENVCKRLSAWETHLFRILDSFENVCKRFHASVESPTWLKVSISQSVVCVYAGMYVCMYVCIHVVLLGSGHACLDLSRVCVRVHVCMYVCMHAFMYVCMYLCVRMHACMYVCNINLCTNRCKKSYWDISQSFGFMYVCMYVFIYIYPYTYVCIHHRARDKQCLCRNICRSSIRMHEVCVCVFVCVSVSERVREYQHASSHATTCFCNGMFPRAFFYAWPCLKTIPTHETSNQRLDRPVKTRLNRTEQGRWYAVFVVEFFLRHSHTYVGKHAHAISLGIVYTNSSSISIAMLSLGILHIPCSCSHVCIPSRHLSCLWSLSEKINLFVWGMDAERLIALIKHRDTSMKNGRGAWARAHGNCRRRSCSSLQLSSQRSDPWQSTRSYQPLHLFAESIPRED